MRLATTILAAALAATLMPRAGADIIRYDFGGTIDTIHDNVGGVIGGVGIGTPFSGSFWFDTDSLDLDPGQSRNGEYVQGSEAGIEVTIAGNAYRFSGESAIIRVRTFLDADFFQFAAQEFGSVSSGNYRFWDFGVALTDADAAAFDSDDLPTDLRAGWFNTRRFKMAGELRNNANADFWLEGDITSLGRHEDPPPPAGPVRGDFNGDGKADLIFRNTVTGRNARWEMNGASRQVGVQITGLGNQSWKMRSLYDFDGDNHTDIVWRNSSNGLNAVWKMSGNTLVESITLPTLRGAHWMMGGVGDFDKDGNMDILWRNSANGSNRVWRLDGTSLVANTQIAGLWNQNWRIGGVDDFDGNGGSDILWRNRATGEVVIWIMNALWRQSVVSLGTVLPTQWEVAGVGDYDGDGVLDIFFYNPNTGLGKMAFLDGLGADARVAQLVDLSHAVTRGWLGAGHEIGVGSAAASAPFAAARATWAATSAAAVVPEPASAAMLAGAALLLVRRRLPGRGRA